MGTDSGSEVSKCQRLCDNEKSIVIIIGIILLPFFFLKLCCISFTPNFFFCPSRGSPYRESPLGHFESYGGTPFFQAQKMFVDVPENAVILDEMTLRHMVQDCTAVKTQLLKLKRLLHQVSAQWACSAPIFWVARRIDVAFKKLNWVFNVCLDFCKNNADKLYIIEIFVGGKK